MISHRFLVRLIAVFSVHTMKLLACWMDDGMDLVGSGLLLVLVSLPIPRPIRGPSVRIVGMID